MSSFPTRDVWKPLKNCATDILFLQSIAMGVGAGERNIVLTQLIGYLLRRYVDPSLVYGLAYGWAKQCTPPIADKEITKTFKSIYTKHTRKE
ncbi:primase alpha helix C-terminal domain-containing protein [Staphylococcus pseudintermedius]|nr:primase alpha helix C-terminal domain-containing protein [Staphylococcus pseudintermedius]